MAAVLVLTLVPTAADNDVELVPFGDLVNAVDDWDAGRLMDVALESTANVLLFVPFGAALAFRGLGLGRATCYGLALSLAVEVAQYFVSGRTTAVDDVLLNGLGTVLGHLLLSSGMTRLAAAGARGPAEWPGKREDDVEIAATREDEE